MPDNETILPREPDDGESTARDHEGADDDPLAVVRALTGAERYLRERLEDPKYAAAHHEARRQLRTHSCSGHEERADSGV